MPRTKPIILSTALTGVRFSPWRKDEEGNAIPITSTKLARNMPVTPEEIESDASSCYFHGARFIHVHARNPNTGEQFADLKYYKNITKRIRKTCPGSIISYPTSRKGEVEEQINKATQEMEEKQGKLLDTHQKAWLEAKIRPIAIEARPDTITSFTVPEMKMFGTPRDATGIEDVPGWTDPEVMKEYYTTLLRRAKELGVHQEIEVQTLGQFDIMQSLYDFGGMEGPIHLVLLPGFSAGFPITREAYETALARVDEFRAYTGLPVTVTCGAVIPPPVSKLSRESEERGKHDYEEVFAWIAEDDRVDVFRTGIEDAPVLYGQQMTNGGLVAHAYDLCLKYGITIETDPSKVRQQFGFPEQAPKPGLAAVFDDLASTVKKFSFKTPKQKNEQTFFG